MKKKLIVGAIFCLSVIGASAITVNTSCGTKTEITCKGCSMGKVLSMVAAIEAYDCGGK